MIEEEPERLTEIPGIGEKTAAKIARLSPPPRIRQYNPLSSEIRHRCRLRLKLYQVYEGDTIKAVEENPYRLVDDVFGIGFRKADKIAAKMGIARDDDFRIKSGVKFTLPILPRKAIHFCRGEAALRKDRTAAGAFDRGS